MQPNLQREKTIVLFRKDAYSIIALLPEIPYDDYDADSCLSYVYFDNAAFFRETGIKYPRHPFTKREADISNTLSRTTRAEPGEYEKVKKLLESQGFCIEVKNEINEEMHSKRHRLAFENGQDLNDKKLKDDLNVNPDIVWDKVFEIFLRIVMFILALLVVYTWHSCTEGP